MSDLQQFHREAVALTRQGNWAAAEEKYREALRRDANHADSWSNLGILYFKTGRVQEACSAFSQSIRLDPTRAIYYCRLGVALEKTSGISAALQAYQQAIGCDAKCVEAYRQMGRIFVDAGHLSKAEDVYKKGIAAQPKFIDAYCNLGKIYLSRQRVDEAIEVYQKAYDLNPKSADIAASLGEAYRAKGEGYEAEASFYTGCAYFQKQQYREAAESYQRFLQLPQSSLKPQDTLRAYRFLTLCYKALDRVEETVETYRDAIRRFPQDTHLHFDLFILLRNCGRNQEAIEAANTAIQCLPNELFFERYRHLFLPIIYDNPDEIRHYRDRFTQGLHQLTEQIPDRLRSPQQSMSLIRGAVNFYLAYQAGNDRDLQTEYGELVHEILAANYPEFVQPRPMPPLTDSGKIRVGYISTCMFRHTVGHLYNGWIRHRDRDKFEAYSYYIGQEDDHITAKFRQHSDSFDKLPKYFHFSDDRVREIANKIIRDRLHVLVYLDIGMEPDATILAGLRLAPVQCMTWGHPVTSGLPTIDYFLTSDLMEPEGADKHYRERLVRLPNISIAYEKPNPPHVTQPRSFFKLRDDAVVYLSSQAIFKYLPQYDFVFAEIARRVPNAQFAFIAHESTRLTQKWKNRLQRAFTAVGLNCEDFCHFYPRLSHPNFLNLNLVSDVLLDTFDWSGGHTTIEAIACHLPVVTCPGEFMRGRHTYAFLTMMGITETIASDEAEYIDIAVRLGTDRPWRDRIVEKMKQCHDRFYEDTTPVRALEAFYREVVSN